MFFSLVGFRPLTTQRLFIFTFRSLWTTSFFIAFEPNIPASYIFLSALLVTRGKSRSLTRISKETLSSLALSKMPVIWASRNKLGVRPKLRLLMRLVSSIKSQLKSLLFVFQLKPPKVLMADQVEIPSTKESTEQQSNDGGWRWAYPSCMLILMYTYPSRSFNPTSIATLRQILTTFAVDSSYQGTEKDVAIFRKMSPGEKIHRWST